MTPLSAKGFVTQLKALRAAAGDRDYATTMPRVTLRYAFEHLPKTGRRATWG